MAASVGPRKSVSIYDYPEHLNPFREEDSHSKLRFWTLGRKLNRSNSITFSGIKDLKNSWALRSFMKKGKKAPTAQAQSNGVNGDVSPIIYRRGVQSSTSMPGGNRTTIGSPERAERYVYGGSITPLPRSRFQERLRSTSQHEVSSLGTPRMARSEISGSRCSVESTNPFDDDTPLPPVRNRRKKKRAPLPPSGLTDISVSSADSDAKTTVENESLIITEEPKQTIDAGNENVTADVQLQIVEDEEEKLKSPEESQLAQKPEDIEKEIAEISTHASNLLKELDKIDETVTITETTQENTESPNKSVQKSDSEDDILNKVSFPKVDIQKYRRNSSINEDDIKLRRGNLEDYHAISSKRSKSLNNDLNLTYISYDINLNEDKPDIDEKDANGNDQPKKVICKLYEDTSRKQSLDNSISSTEREFIEIDKATREFEREISKLNSALIEDDDVVTRLSVSDIKRKFDSNANTPNPIPKPRRSPYGSNSPISGNYT